MEALQQAAAAAAAVDTSAGTPGPGASASQGWQADARRAASENALLRAELQVRQGCGCYGWGGGRQQGWAEWFKGVIIDIECGWARAFFIVSIIDACCKGMWGASCLSTGSSDAC